MQLDTAYQRMSEERRAKMLAEVLAYGFVPDKRDDEFTIEEFRDDALKHGRILSYKKARQGLMQLVEDGRLQVRRLGNNRPYLFRPGPKWETKAEEEGKPGEE